MAMQQATPHQVQQDLLMELLSAYALESIAEKDRPYWWGGMGHIGQVPEEVAAYHRLAANPKVRTICEVGFNAGHSSAVMLAANPNAVLYSFDVLSLPYSQRAVGLFKTALKGRFFSIQGSSFDTVPWLHRTKPNVQCDLFSVDGDHSHDGALTDFLNAVAMMPVGATLLADDVTARFGGCKQAWEEMVKEGYLTDPVCESPAASLGADVGQKGWCYATVAKTTGSLVPQIKPAAQDFNIQ